MERNGTAQYGRRGGNKAKAGSESVKRAVLKNCMAWAAAIAALLVVWIAAYFAVGNELLVPSFADCMQKLGELCTESGFWKSFSATLLRVFQAFGTSLILAAFFAVVAYLLPVFGRFFAPIVSVMRSLPTLAVLLIVLVWAGAGTAPVVVAFLSLFPMLYAGFSAALAEVDGGLLEMSRAYRVPLKKRIFDLYLPSVAPQALKTSGAAVSFAIKLVASAEVLAATWKSLGGMMQEAKIYLDMPLLFALVCVTCLTGLVLELLFAVAANVAERRVK